MCLAAIVETRKPRLVTDVTADLGATVLGEMVLSIAAGAEAGATPGRGCIRLAECHHVVEDVLNIATAYGSWQFVHITGWIQDVPEREKDSNDQRAGSIGPS